MNFIAGEWRKSHGAPFRSENPASGEVLWEGHGSDQRDINAAVAAAQRASIEWALTPVDERYSYLTAYKELVEREKEALATTIAQEVGKPLWEARSEVDAVIAKVAISRSAFEERCPTHHHGAAITRHKPHGVLAVLGPFNFPCHLPNGHIIPALLAGNSIVLKASELAPHSAEKMVALWEESGLPSGVLNLVQGGGESGRWLSHHPQIDGLLFTGSWKTGQALAQQFATEPGKILALEMGGNTPIVVSTVEDLAAAAYITIQSAFLTSGQRCSCARRLILPATAQRDAFIEMLIAMTQQIVVGSYDAIPEPFMGPLIHATAAERLIAAQEVMLKNGAAALLPMERFNAGSAFLSPGIIDVTDLSQRRDEELFGPLLQLQRVATFADAIAAANNTAFGLAAALLSNAPDEYRIFYKSAHAGIINWNCPTTGAASSAPFGGIGQSGNQRPSAYYAADYCSYPVASMETSALSPTATPGLTLPPLKK